MHMIALLAIITFFFVSLDGLSAARPVNLLNASTINLSIALGHWSKLDTHQGDVKGNLIRLRHVSIERWPEAFEAVDVTRDKLGRKDAFF